ncbi:uncharacterized protein LOC133187100 [Saccostrea echinata]|uniref:uncharacterized protein LOC133187100 n=1 Tax=Saccostrea echinata TaxID=191078 RepID=UPI002A820581|nr:uncharacterized protein LOC133187100 [Saccostrea echinata]
MPSNEDFSVSILVGDTILPEYLRAGMCYVECDFFSPFSFKQKTEEKVGDEIETQEQPVTPFSICISAKPGLSAYQHYYYRVFIDGQKVTSRSIQQGENKIIKGFRDGIMVKEFLFSMPSLKQSQSEAPSSDRVGWIDVECWNATLKATKRSVRNRRLDFTSGSKKDSLRITQGKYMMTTTKAGRVLQLKNAYRSTDYWDLNSLRSKLSIKYVTAQDLRDMGVAVIPIPYPAHLPHNQGRELRGQSVDLSQGLAGTEYDTKGGNREETGEKIIVDSNIVTLDGNNDPGSLDSVKEDVEVTSQRSGTSNETVKVKKEATFLGTDIVIDLCDLDDQEDLTSSKVIVLD